MDSSSTSASTSNHREQLSRKIQELKEYPKILQDSFKSIMGQILMQASRLSLTNANNGDGGVGMSDSMSSTSINPQTQAKLDHIKYYFASRTSAYDDIWNVCHRLSLEIQEQVLDVFILTFIDHWDKELERYVLLCERCLIIMDFDFQTLQTKQLFIYDYSRFNLIKVGPLIYPQMAFNYSHRSKYAMRFQWDSHKPLNYRHYWNPWSKEIPWITLTEHPLASYIDDLLADLTEPLVLDPVDPDACNNHHQQSSSLTSSTYAAIDDQYFSKEYLQQIRRRFCLGTFHDKLLEIMNSFQQPPVELPVRLEMRNVNQADLVQDAIQQNIMVKFQHTNVKENDMTLLFYRPIMCDNYFNLPAMLYNRSSFGYYRLRLF